MVLEPDQLCELDSEAETLSVGVNDIVVEGFGDVDSESDPLVVSVKV